MSGVFWVKYTGKRICLFNYISCIFQCSKLAVLTLLICRKILLLQILQKKNETDKMCKKVLHSDFNRNTLFRILAWSISALFCITWTGCNSCVGWHHTPHKNLGIIFHFSKMKEVIMKNIISLLVLICSIVVLIVFRPSLLMDTSAAKQKDRMRKKVLHSSFNRNIICENCKVFWFVPEIICSF